MGADTWFVVRVNSHGPVRQDVSVKDERTRELVKQDFLTYKFFEWSKGVIANAKIK